MSTTVVLMVCALAAHGAADSRKQYCGDRLTSKLYRLCDGLYNKRSGLIFTGLFTSRPASSELLSPIQGRSVVQELSGRIGRRREGRHRRGVVDECCRRGCTIRELKAYCLND